MNRIFIEAKHSKTSECCFLKTVLKNNFPDKSCGITCMDGVDNLFSQGILTSIRADQDNGDNVIVILDADTLDKRWGFEARKRNTIEKMRENKVEFPFFLYPNNHDDGDFEVLLETLARKDLHNKWWDCFADYETCVSGIRDESGEPRYIIPNRKAKLHTYISSQRLNNASRKKLGSGQWLFDNPDYWDFSRPELEPLVEFLKENLE